MHTNSGIACFMAPVQNGRFLPLPTKRRAKKGHQIIRKNVFTPFAAPTWAAAHAALRHWWAIIKICLRRPKDKKMALTFTAVRLPYWNIVVTFAWTHHCAETSRPKSKHDNFGKFENNWSYVGLLLQGLSLGFNETLWSRSLKWRRRNGCIVSCRWTWQLSAQLLWISN